MITSSYKPIAGRYLISEPFMADSNFQRTVVLLVEHGEQGSLGFVLNRKLKVKIGEVVEDLGTINSPVFMGGPVEQNSLHYVHRLGDKINGSREVYKGLYWGGNFEELSRLIQMGMVQNDDILFFIGYSGWSPGQLEEELERKSWIIAPENPDFIFRETHKELWRDILKSMGDKYQIISNYPQDPRLN
ncbi:MAG: YqgE/AlgH family protein [Bacteroidota bacterium]